MGRREMLEIARRALKIENPVVAFHATVESESAVKRNPIPLPSAEASTRAPPGWGVPSAKDEAMSLIRASSLNASVHVRIGWRPEKGAW